MKIVCISNNIYVFLVEIQFYIMSSIVSLEKKLRKDLSDFQNTRLFEY